MERMCFHMLVVPKLYCFTVPCDSCFLHNWHVTNRPDTSPAVSLKKAQTGDSFFFSGNSGRINDVPGLPAASPAYFYFFVLNNLFYECVLNSWDALGLPAGPTRRRKNTSCTWRPHGSPGGAILFIKIY